MRFKSVDEQTHYQKKRISTERGRSKLYHHVLE